MPARGYGDYHQQKVVALEWACAAQGCQLHHQSCNILDPRGKAEAGSPEDSLAKNVEVEMKNMNHCWSTIQWLANDRQGWKSFIAALYANWHDG